MHRVAALRGRAVPAALLAVRGARGEWLGHCSCLCRPRCCLQDPTHHALAVQGRLGIPLRSSGFLTVEHGGVKALCGSVREGFELLCEKHLILEFQMLLSVVIIGSS